MLTLDALSSETGMLCEKNKTGYQKLQQKGLILAQNERWRRGSGMQVERESPSGRVKWQKG